MKVRDVTTDPAENKNMNCCHTNELNTRPWEHCYVRNVKVSCTITHEPLWWEMSLHLFMSTSLVHVFLWCFSTVNTSNFIYKECVISHTHVITDVNISSEVVKSGQCMQILRLQVP